MNNGASTYVPPLNPHATVKWHYFGYDVRRWRHVTQMPDGDDRDWQRGKVYKTEWEFDWSFDASRDMTQYQVVDMVKKVLRSSVVTKRWGSGRDMRVEFSNRRRGACAWQRKMAFGPKSRKPFVILHEIAHTLCPPFEHHGRLFVRTYLELIGWFIGKEEQKRFKKALRENKVKISPRRG